MSDERVTTENTINPYLAGQSRYAIGQARNLYDSNAPLPSQYVGISDPSELAMDQIMGIAGQRGGSMVPGAALNEWQKTLQGGYLNANPYIDEIVNRASSRAGAAPVSGYAQQGRFGSGVMANAIADATTQTASNLYGQNYQNERGRMMDALGQSGAMEALQYADAGRLAGVGQRYEADEAAQAREALAQYMHPYMKQQMFEGSLAVSPLNREGKSVTSKPFDWFAAIAEGASGGMGG